jgi:hypothetical protein
MHVEVLRISHWCFTFYDKIKITYVYIVVPTIRESLRVCKGFPTYIIPFSPPEFQQTFASVEFGNILNQFIDSIVWHNGRVIFGFSPVKSQQSMSRRLICSNLIQLPDKQVPQVRPRSSRTHNALSTLIARLRRQRTYFFNIVSGKFTRRQGYRPLHK